jgi:hypothetical protein
MVYDIKTRFFKLGLPEYIINSSLDLNSESANNDFFLKICLGGAFLGKFAKAEFKNNQNNDKKIYSEDYISIYFNNLPKFITSAHLK